eukprot:264880_1
MGACLDRQTKPDGKPEHLQQKPESYSNNSTYFVQQIVALITHEFHDQPPDVIDTLLLTYIYFTDSIVLFEAIRERFLIYYETYSYITWEQEQVGNPAPIVSSKSPSIIASNKSNSSLAAVTGMRNSIINIVYNPTKVLSKSEWIKEVKMAIQRKCLDILLLWIERYWNEDFHPNELNNNDNDESKSSQPNELFEKLKQFATEIKQERDNILNYNKETEAMKQIQKQYFVFLQEYIFKIENIVNTQQEWHKNVMGELKQKQLKQQELLQEQIRKSKRHLRHQKYALQSDAIPGHSRHHTATYSDNIFKIDLIEPIEDDILTEMNDQHSYTHSEQSISIEEEQNQLANSLLFITIKNKSNAVEYAKQLTLLDWDSFIHIKPRQFLAKVLNKKQNKKWERLKAFIDRFKQTHQYVIVSIIAAPSLQSRVEMINFFIYVAESLLKLNNLYSFMAVCTALDSVQIQKLETSWEFIGKSSKRKFYQFLSPLCCGKNNYKKLRAHCAKLKPPGIPFLGIVLQDITFANDGNRNKWSKKEDSHINFYKYETLHSICKTVIYLQNGSYSKVDEQFKDLFDENDPQFLEKRASRNIDSINIDYLSDDVDGNKSREPSTSFREPSKSASKSLAIYNASGDREFDLGHDYALQQSIIKDFHSYILLNKSIIRAMSVEANRIDAYEREKYVVDNCDSKLSLANNEKESKGIFKLFKRKSKSVNKNVKNANPIAAIAE